jgi:uncharacterized protein (DUF362 family)
LEKFKVSIVKGKDVQRMVEEAVDKIGGIKDIVPKGSKVMLKPNLLMATKNPGPVTNPKVTEAVIKIVKKARPKEIIVAESAMVGFDTVKAFEVSGTKDVAEKNGVKWLDLKKDKIVEIPVPKGKIIKSIKLPESYLNCNVFINLPVMKTHCQTGVTLGLKNMKGLLPDDEKKRVHLENLEQAIADYNTVLKNDLTVMDATTAIEGFGPESPPGKPVQMDLIIAGRNNLAVDMVASAVMGIDYKTIRHLKNAVLIGLGPRKMDEIEVKGKSVQEVMRKFEQPPKDLVAMPGVKMIVGSPCSACVSEYMFAAVQLERMGILPRIKDLTIAIGPKAKDILPKNVEGKLLLLGKCLDGCQQGIHAPGCPPFVFDAIAKIYGEKSLEERLKEDEPTKSKAIPH